MLFVASAEAHRPLPEASPLLLPGRWRPRAPSRVCFAAFPYGKVEEEDHHERRIRRKRRVGRRSFTAAAGARGGASPLSLDSQALHLQGSPQKLWIGPVPGDIAEVEAYCRIFRAAEQLHNAIMKTVCNPDTGECTISYDIPSEMLPQLEEKVVSMLGCMLALLDKGREEVLSGRLHLAQSFRAEDVNASDGRLPPLAVFRGEVKRCCGGLLAALANYPTTDERSVDIWRKLQRLRNVCYDAGFPPGEGQPYPTIFANWAPVCFTAKDSLASEDCEVAFWKGGQVTDEGLTWLVEKGYKTVVDLRKEVSEDKYYQSALEYALSHGKIEVIKLPVEARMAPSRKQVDLFASLVSDPSKRPLYLHSQEGVYRTSAMVSRWRQYLARSAAQPTPKVTSTFSGISKKNSDAHDRSEIEDYGTSDNGNGVVCGKPCSSHEMLGADVSHDFIAGTRKNGDMESQEDSPKNKLPSLMNDGGKGDSDLSSFKDINPLSAQFPTGNIFSRKEVIRFFNKKGASQTYFNFYRTKWRNKFTPTETSVHNVNFTSRDSFPTQTGDYDYHVGQLNHNDDHSPSSNLNGFLGGDNGAKSTHASNMSRETNAQDLLARTKSDPDKNVNGSVAPASNNMEVAEANMCASTTGVVRVQSRKKAEMFLVRTDGFTCTREKVTESSLAFTHPSTQQQMLLWKSTPKTVLLLKKLGKGLLKETKKVASFLHHQKEMNVLVEPDVHDMLARTPGFGFVQTFYSQDTSDLHERVDFIACLGGDGVILHASNIFRGAVPPVVSFNLGSLGFLTSHSFDDHKRDLGAVIHGNNTLDGIYITLRMRLHCEIFRNGKPVSGKVFEVLNEVVVDRGSNPYISKIECYEHNRLITKVQGDGVIIATPTGSTAYSTAAGGSVVHPNVPCMLFTPICPHSLSFRPVILPDSAQLELKIPKDARSNAWVSFDGKRRQQLSRGDSVRISMSEHPLPTVNKSDQTGDWFRSLIQCLNWNERLEQQAL